MCKNNYNVIFSAYFTKIELISLRILTMNTMISSCKAGTSTSLTKLQLSPVDIFAQ